MTTRRPPAPRKAKAVPAKAKAAPRTVRAADRGQAATKPQASRTSSLKLDEPSAAYLRIIEDIWKAVAPLVGAITLSALVQSALRRATAKHPLLAGVAISIDGVDRTSLIEALRPATDHAQAEAMAELGKQLLDVFESVAGTLIIKQVIPLTLELDQQVTAQRGRG